MIQAPESQGSEGGSQGPNPPRGGEAGGIGGRPCHHGVTGLEGEQGGWWEESSPPGPARSHRVGLRLSGQGPFLQLGGGHQTLVLIKVGAGLRGEAREAWVRGNHDVGRPCHRPASPHAWPLRYPSKMENTFWSRSQEAIHLFLVDENGKLALAGEADAQEGGAHPKHGGQGVAPHLRIVECMLDGWRC